MKTVAAIIFAICSAALTTNTIACTCGVANGDPEHDVPLFFDGSTAVVVAEAQEASSTARVKEHTVDMQVQSVTWVVEVSFKGPHLPGHIIHSKTDTTCCMCGMSVETGKVYLLYLQGEEPYSLSECSLSKELKYRLPHIPVLYRLQSAANTASGT